MLFCKGGKKRHAHNPQFWKRQHPLHIPLKNHYFGAQCDKDHADQFLIQIWLINLMCEFLEKKPQTPLCIKKTQTHKKHYNWFIFIVICFCFYKGPVIHILLQYVLKLRTTRYQTATDSCYPFTMLCW